MRYRDLERRNLKDSIPLFNDSVTSSVAGQQTCRIVFDSSPLFYFYVKLKTKDARSSLEDGKCLGLLNDFSQMLTFVTYVKMNFHRTMPKLKCNHREQFH